MENHYVYWKSPLLMVIFLSYLKFPEGRSPKEFPGISGDGFISQSWLGTRCSRWHASAALTGRPWRLVTSKSAIGSAVNGPRCINMSQVLNLPKVAIIYDLLCCYYDLLY